MLEYLKRKIVVHWEGARVYRVSIRKLGPFEVLAMAINIQLLMKAAVNAEMNIIRVKNETKLKLGEVLQKAMIEKRTRAIRNVFDKLNMVDDESILDENSVTPELLA